MSICRERETVGTTRIKPVNSVRLSSSVLVALSIVILAMCSTGCDGAIGSSDPAGHVGDSVSTDGGLSSGDASAGDHQFGDSVPTESPPLQFDGDFYGSSYGGSAAANASIRRYQNGIRFQAMHSGRVDAVTIQNRHLDQATVEGRCSSSGLAIWCNCVDNNLTPAECGWTLGNSYSAGNGGLQTASLHQDDGSSSHLPDLSGTMATSAAYVPTDLPGNAMIVVPFLTPASVTKGQYYHVLFTNSNMPPGAGCTRQDNATAQSWSDNHGCIGFNGWNYEPDEISTNPVFRNWMVYGRNDPNDSFSFDTNNLAFFSTRYTTGDWYGDTYARWNVSSLGGIQPVGGDYRARQSFTIDGPARPVDGLWVNVDRQSGSGDLSATLGDSTGAILATAVYLNSSISTAGTFGSWIYQDLSSPVTLETDQHYVLELSAPTGTTVHVFAAAPLEYPSYNAPQDRNYWGRFAKSQDSAWVEYSSDSGASWDSRGSIYVGRDLNVLFTISGKPKQVASP